MLVAERGASAATREAYRRDLTGLAQSCGTSALETLTLADLQAYLASQQKSGMDASTQARRLSALRQFYRFLLSENIIAADPTSQLDAPRRARRLPGVLSEEIGRAHV